MSYVKNFFGFGASPWGLTSGKNFMVIRPAVPEILGGGGGTTPQMLLACQKQQMLLTVKTTSRENIHIFTINKKCM